MDNKKMERQALLEHYKELNQTGRHYNTQFWLIPGATFTIAGFLISKAFSSELSDDLHRKILLWLSALITFVFVLKMIHQRVYHVQNKNRIKKTKKELKIHKLTKVKDSICITLWTKCVNVASITITIMVLLLIFQIIIACCWSGLNPR